ncbi:hypothetical protein BDV97DRAFT_365834 [Delphinella strobiligena]|nr:hypothetical protein BDV97DRAFT_365834 [Delphinella strobiligena]
MALVRLTAAQHASRFSSATWFWERRLYSDEACDDFRKPPQAIGLSWIHECHPLARDSARSAPHLCPICNRKESEYSPNVFHVGRNAISAFAPFTRFPFPTQAATIIRAWWQPTLWLTVLTLTSEDFLKVVLAVIVIRITRMIGRCANARTAFHNQLMKPEKRGYAYPAAKKKKDVSPRYPSHKGSCGFTILLGPLVLPLTPNVDRGRTSSLLDCAGQTQSSSPRHNQESDAYAIPERWR